jgi:microcompartment protein CcmL/EutN
METLSGDLLVFEAPSVVTGFSALAALPSEGFQLIDASPSGGGRFLILVKGEGKLLQTVQKAMRDAIVDEVGYDEPVDHELIEKANASVLEAAYSLLPQKMGASLVVIETETASAMFAAAQVFVEHQKLTPLEIKIRKTGAQGAYGFFTGEAAQCALAAEDVRVRFKNAVREAKILVFDQPNAAIRSLFEGA